MRPIHGMAVVGFLIAGFCTAFGAVEMIQKKAYYAAAFFIVASLWLIITDAILFAKWLQQ